MWMENITRVTDFESDGIKVSGIERIRKSHSIGVCA
jgi:hypothetical protein